MYLIFIFPVYLRFGHLEGIREYSMEEFKASKMSANLASVSHCNLLHLTSSVDSFALLVR